MTDLLINGLIDFTWMEYIIYTLIVTQITIMAITLYLHRGVCHSAIEIKPALSHFFRFWLWFTTSMKTADWVAIHRKHHAKSETEDDPYSITEGFCNLGAFLIYNIKNDKYSEIQLEKMNKNPDPNYGVGYRNMKQCLDQKGWEVFIKEVKDGNAKLCY